MAKIFVISIDFTAFVISGAFAVKPPLMSNRT